jgi:hypothetical protein
VLQRLIVTLAVASRNAHPARPVAGEKVDAATRERAGEAVELDAVRHVLEKETRWTRTSREDSHTPACGDNEVVLRCHSRGSLSEPAITTTSRSCRSTTCRHGCRVRRRQFCLGFVA